MFDKVMTRRKFLEITGKGAAGLAASASLLKLFGVTKAQAESGAVSVYATPDFVIVANKAKCTGCQRCELNCTLANDGDCHPYMSRIRVRDVVNYGDTIDANKAIGGNYQKLETEEQVKLMEKLIEIMEDDDDVQNVWHNWEE